MVARHREAALRVHAADSVRGLQVESRHCNVLAVEQVFVHPAATAELALVSEAITPPPDITRDHAPRQPWLAVLLSLVTTGLGQVYAGRPMRAMLVWLACTTWAVLGVVATVRLSGSAEIVAFAVTILGGPAWAAWDAAQLARRAGATYRPRRFNRWYVYVALIAVSVFVWQPVFTTLVRERLITTFRLASRAMEPTLLGGDYILSHRMRGNITRGDIVVHRSARGSIVQRVVALPGDRVGMRSGRLFVNDRAVVEPYAQRDTADPSSPEFMWQSAHLPATRDSGTHRPTLHTWGPILVPLDGYFLLGDNRNNSLDSRYLGFVMRDSIVGRPSSVYLSRAPETGSIRWGRIGRSASR